MNIFATKIQAIRRWLQRLVRWFRSTHTHSRSAASKRLSYREEEINRLVASWPDSWFPLSDAERAQLEILQYELAYLKCFESISCEGRDVSKRYLGKFQVVEP